MRVWVAGERSFGKLLRVGQVEIEVKWEDGGSEWRCSMLESRVHPVILRRAAFWMTCSLLREVFEMIGDQTVLLYSRTGRVMAL